MDTEPIPVEEMDLETLRDRLRVAERKLALAEAQAAIARIALPAPGRRAVAGAVPSQLEGLGPALDVLFHTAKVSLMLTAMDGTILRANQGAAELFGLPLTDLPGRRTIDLTLPDDVAETESALTKVEDGRYIVKHYVRADGTRVAALAMGWPLVDDDGTPVCIFGVAVPLRTMSVTRSLLHLLRDEGRAATPPA